MGLEPITSGLEVLRAIQLRHWGVVTVGFEPTKHDASDLKSDPFNQTRERYHVSLVGLEPTTFGS